ncbi:hypothetical protein SUGI_0746460 [Cryptomeria japonica]|nr:hypothetical protein SUGI_0746460 [Cryptomeria japonica]
MGRNQELGFPLKLVKSHLDKKACDLYSLAVLIQVCGDGVDLSPVENISVLPLGQGNALGMGDENFMAFPDNTPLNSPRLEVLVIYPDEQLIVQLQNLVNKNNIVLDSLTMDRVINSIDNDLTPLNKNLSIPPCNPFDVLLNEKGIDKENMPPFVREVTLITENNLPIV